MGSITLYCVHLTSPAHIWRPRRERPMKTSGNSRKCRYKNTFAQGISSTRHGKHSATSPEISKEKRLSSITIKISETTWKNFPVNKRFYKNTAGCISRVLYLQEGLCHLSRPTVTRTTHQQPTPRHRTSNPTASVYMVLQPVRRTAKVCHHTRGGLLPRLFTLTGIANNPGGYSLLHYYSLTEIFPLGRTALCVARTFLPLRSNGGSGRATLLRGAKVHNNQQRSIRLNHFIVTFALAAASAA